MTDSRSNDVTDPQELPVDHRSGFVAVVGKPNVGKSTLLNALLGERLAIVSPKPQTTRTRQLGILTTEHAQVIFVDTPGIHLARNRLGDYMVNTASDSIPDADIVLFIVDISEPPDMADSKIAQLVSKHDTGRVIYLFNKIDLLGDDTVGNLSGYQQLLPDCEPFPISAATGINIEELKDRIVTLLPVGPQYYPPDQLSDMYLRESAAELIREQVLLLYEQELPHSVAVVVEEFKERDDNMTYIRAVIYVEKDSQKSIIIGKQGSALKHLGKAARESLQEMIGTRIYLDLWVKVLKNWRKDDRALRRLGYSSSDE